MENILKQKLSDYIVANNPDLVVKLQAAFSMTAFINDRLKLVEGLLGESAMASKPAYITEELCMAEMTADLRPSRFNYLLEVVEVEFPEEYRKLQKSGVLIYELINLIGICQPHFETFGFSEETEGDRFLRYAVISAIHEYFN